ncbi:MAG: hypothetical protein A2W98_05005 [Bacteroidetes bacterium GWF2_33_38]|nr:MAG: hypothetical protein A2W98_05005 [Bacteroidetes bacterium GWF2_33_38]OFY68652.1 MAG: hypothetical protein A2265_10900 [Bacteroidetes bacterium RIFOXYA12_FULL_33_9]OFY92036.1 MAG: hypothetical protein A2236_06975 [Bacteroidetes bacterium RIFOXYA2_FULL_33_7]
MEAEDKYVHEMDWGINIGNVSKKKLSNYRKYQYNLIRKYIGNNILEVGSGDRGFTNQIVLNAKPFQSILSIEPSEKLFEIYKDSYLFPDNVSFKKIDLFEMSNQEYGKFDTIIMIHVLEHIEDDKGAINHLYNLLCDGGHLLIEVPALQKLYSIHDEKLGHYRRYNKKIMKRIIDEDKFELKRIWYQDIIGVLGSFYYFKLKKTRINSESGARLVSKQGNIYDKYLIPIQEIFEKFIPLPLGLSLTCVLKKK